jgi:hypothetical protein
VKIGKLKLFESAKYIGGKEDPLLIRWILFRIPSFGIFIHKFCRSDYDRALHDHPWTFISYILKGGYYEFTESGIEWIGPGRRLYRPAEFKHRVVLQQLSNGLKKWLEPPDPSWSLVFVFRRRRKWGFWLKDKWCWWRQYDYDKAICSEDILWTDEND